MPSNEFKVILEQEAREFLLKVPNKAYEKAIHSLLLLRSTPFIGRMYDPEFESAKPPEGCRRLVVSGTTIEIFYVVEEDKSRVSVVYIDDSRMNPLQRFQSAKEA